MKKEDNPHTPPKTKDPKTTGVEKKEDAVANEQDSLPPTEKEPEHEETVVNEQVQNDIVNGQESAAGDVV